MNERCRQALAYILGDSSNATNYSNEAQLALCAKVARSVNGNNNTQQPDSDDNSVSTTWD